MRILIVVTIMLALFIPVYWYGAILTNARPILLGAFEVTRELVPMVNWSCSGVLLEDGRRVATARHCVTDGSYQFVRFPDAIVNARVECSTVVALDFAILTLVDSRPTRGAQLDDAPLAYWEEVTVAGYPKGQWIVFRGNVLGVAERTWVSTLVTYLERVVEVTNPNGPGNMGGVSGGPVFDEQGRVRGIVCCQNVITSTIGVLPLREQVATCRP